MTEETAYQIETEVFTGPFDVLLKAIDEGSIDIHRVSLSSIVNSYFEYWKKEEPDLVVAADFLYMAAYLLELKTRALLPARDEAIDEQFLIEMEESLVSHVQEYEVYKSMAQTLRERKEVFEKVYGRHEGEPQEKEFELVDVNLKDLLLAFKTVYAEAAKRERVVPIAAEEITLEGRIVEVKRLIAGRKDGVPFADIFIRKTRLEIVVTFLAILELAKEKFLRIAQSQRFGSILIFPRDLFEKEPEDAA